MEFSHLGILVTAVAVQFSGVIAQADYTAISAERNSVETATIINFSHP